jgi:two-component system, cell cycle response regulator DivK
MPPSDTAQVALIVEDNPDNMLLTKAVLRRAGYRTAEARSAEEALEQLRLCEPDLVLMDIQLPGRDGLSLTRQMRADPRLADIPIIALSAHAMHDSHAQAIAAGCDGYITKPIDTRAFAGQLAAALESSQRRAGQAS